MPESDRKGWVVDLSEEAVLATERTELDEDNEAGVWVVVVVFLEDAVFDVVGGNDDEDEDDDGMGWEAFADDVELAPFRAVEGSDNVPR